MKSKESELIPKMKNQKSLAWQIIKKLTTKLKIQRIVIIVLFALCIWLGFSGGR